MQNILVIALLLASVINVESLLDFEVEPGKVRDFTAEETIKVKAQFISKNQGVAPFSKKIEKYFPLGTLKFLMESTI